MQLERQVYIGEQKEIRVEGLSPSSSWRKHFLSVGVIIFFQWLASLECFSGPDLGKEFVMSVFFTPLVFWDGCKSPFPRKSVVVSSFLKWFQWDLMLKLGQCLFGHFFFKGQVYFGRELTQIWTKEKGRKWIWLIKNELFREEFMEEVRFEGGWKDD